MLLLLNRLLPALLSRALPRARLLLHLLRLALAREQQVLLRALDDSNDVVAVELRERRLEVELVLCGLGLGLRLRLAPVRVADLLRVGPVVVVRGALELALLLVLLLVAASLAAAGLGLALALDFLTLVRPLFELVVALVRGRLVSSLLHLLCYVVLAVLATLTLEWLPLLLLLGTVTLHRRAVRPTSNVLGESVEPAREAWLRREVGVQPSGDLAPGVDAVKVVQRHLARVDVVLQGRGSESARQTGVSDGRSRTERRTSVMVRPISSNSSTSSSPA